MPFIPNEADAGEADQAEPDAQDFDALAAGSNLTGVVSGCAVTAQGTPDMTVAVASGEVVVAGTRAAVTGGNLTITTAHATLPRFDLVVVNSSGVKSVVAGTAATNRAFPAIPASSTLLAAVSVPAGDTTISTAQIRDKRVFISPVPGDSVVSGTSFGQGSAVGTGTEYAREDHGHGTPTNPVTAHEAAADPHTGYQKESEKGAANGYASLDGTGVVPDAQIPAAIARDSEVTTAVTNHSAAADPHTGYQRELTTNYDLAKARSMTLVQEKSQTVTLDTGQNLVHGSAMANGRLFLTTRTSPAYCIRCNNLEDLTDRTSFQWPSDGNHNTADSCVYVAETNRLYVGFSSGKVAEVHPDTLATADVITVSGTFDAIVLASDGTNLYITTDETAPCRVLKYRLSDFTLQGTATITGRADAHAMLWDGDKIYVTAPGAPAWAARVNTSDMSFTDASLTGITSLTDDIASVGDYIYAGREQGSGQNLIRIDKAALTAEVIPAYADIIYGVHYDGRYVWLGHHTTPGKITCFDPNTGATGTLTLPTGEDSPNEIWSDGTRLFVTCWMSPSKIKRFVPSGVLAIPFVNRVALSHTADGNTGSSEQTLLSAGIPGLTFGLSGGKALRITASGRFAANTNAKRILLKFGTGSPVTVFDTGSLAFNDAQWWLDAICISTASNAQDWVCKWISDSSLLATEVQHNTSTQADTSIINVLVRGVGVADNDVINESLLVEVIN